MRRALIFILFLTPTLLFGQDLLGEFGPKTKVTLLVETARAQPGDTIDAGLLLKMADGVHTYWRNPGGNGIATTVKWTLPAGVSAGALRWPVPEKVEWSELFTYAYHDEALLIVSLTLSTDLKPGEYPLKGEVEWLECKETCTPGDAVVTATLVVAGETEPGPQTATFKKWRARMPSKSAPPNLGAQWIGVPNAKGERPVQLTVPVSSPDIVVNFLPYSDEGKPWSIAHATQHAPSKTSVTLTKTITSEQSQWPGELAGVLRFEQDGMVTGHQITLKITDPGGAGAAEGPAEPERPWTERMEIALKNALEKGNWVSFLMVFVGGVLASLTPCVYPMIPITISYIGDSAKGSTLKGFILSLWYVLGIAIVYSGLGLLAAATKTGFGSFTQTPLFTSILAGLIGLMGLSMAGLFDLRLPGFLANMGGGRKGFWGPLLMGMAMGIVAAPCVGPVLIVILTWVAQTGSLFMGFWLLFTFALGLGVLFVVLGTFSGLLTSLPGAGQWMETVKHGFAIILFALALWFLRVYVPGWLLTMVFGCALFLCLSAWGVHKPLAEDASARAGLAMGFKRFLFMLGVILAVLGGLRGLAPDLLPAGAGGSFASAGGAQAEAKPDWIGDEQEGFAKAAEMNKPVLMDFWAEWCIACNELDDYTFNKEEILKLAGEFVMIKIDVTKRKDPVNQAIRAKHNVFGMPTVIFFDAKGNRLDEFTFSGFKSAADLAGIMRRVLAATGKATAARD